MGSDHTIGVQNKILDNCENFDTAYNDGDLEKKKSLPTIIGLIGDKVYYTNTSEKLVEYNSRKLDGGRGEKFPSNLTAALPIKSKNPKDGYFLHLFREDKYCFRPIYPPNDTSDVEYCPKWRDNSELFGCLTTSTPGTPESDPSSPIIMGIFAIVIVVLVVLIAFMVYFIIRGKETAQSGSGSSVQPAHSAKPSQSKL